MWGVTEELKLATGATVAGIGSWQAKNSLRAFFFLRESSSMHRKPRLDQRFGIEHPEKTPNLMPSCSPGPENLAANIWTVAGVPYCLVNGLVTVGFFFIPTYVWVWFFFLQIGLLILHPEIQVRKFHLSLLPASSTLLQHLPFEV